MSGYEQHGMGGYPYGSHHPSQAPPAPHHPHAPPQHQHYQYQHHQQPHYHHAPPPPPPPPPQQHQQQHQQQQHQSSHPVPHQPPTLPPMSQYPGHGPPPQMPPQMPPPDMASNGPSHPSQIPSEPQRSIEPVSRQDKDGTSYKLDVLQQPKRARMCGFGDKDRRPVTPPPCVRLVIIDPSTGKELDCNDIDHSMFVLNVDLWSEDGQREVNMVRHTSSAPSISSTTPCSYTAITESNAPYQNILPSGASHRDGQYPPHSGSMGYPSQPQSQYPPSYGAPAAYPVQQQYGQPNGYSSNPAYPNYSNGMSADYPRSEFGSAHFHARNAIGGAGAPQGMYTRNLIGSLAASAFRLSDPDDRVGIWFVLQDLSVRTEGTFRLRFSFVSVGPPVRVPNGQPNAGSVTRAPRAPVLASCYSEPFTVFSAKKFPGVCESTALSKCFASQGIKIPIRKEGQDSKRNRDDDDDDY